MSLKPKGISSVAILAEELLRVDSFLLFLLIKQRSFPLEYRARLARLSERRSVIVGMLGGDLHDRR